MTWTRALVMAWLIAGPALGNRALFAQTILGRISGAVRDASGAVVPAARVTVANQATRLTWSAVTDNGGKLSMGPLQVPGGGWILQCMDPQGATFALVACKR